MRLKCQADSFICGVTRSCLKSGCCFRLMNCLKNGCYFRCLRSGCRNLRCLKNGLRYCFRSCCRKTFLKNSLWKSLQKKTVKKWMRNFFCKLSFRCYAEWWQERCCRLPFGKSLLMCRMKRCFL